MILRFCFFALVIFPRASHALQDVSIHFSRVNKQGFILVDDLQIKNKKMQLNGMTLPKSQQANASRFIKLSEQAPVLKSCASGEFTLQIQQSSKKVTRKGCTEGESYASLIGILAQLKQALR